MEEQKGAKTNMEGCQPDRDNGASPVWGVANLRKGVRELYLLKEYSHQPTRGINYVNF